MSNESQTISHLRRRHFGAGRYFRFRRCHRSDRGDKRFGSTWWFDHRENWAHLIRGVVGLIAAFTFPASAQQSLVMLLGLLGIFVGVYNVFSTKFLGANLESPADIILHAVVGASTLWVSMGQVKTMSAPAMPSTPLQPAM